MYKAIFWDVDDTLLDFQAGSRQALAESFTRFGLPFEKDTYTLFGKINQALWAQHELGLIGKKELLLRRFEQLFERLGIAGDPEEFGQVFLERLGCQHQLVSGAKEVLAYTGGRYAQYVITNGFSLTQRSRIEAAGLREYFQALFISEEAGFQKPMKAFFEYCFEHLGLFDPTEALIVGDSLSSDIQGGKNAGLDTCWYNPQGLPAPAEPTFTHQIQELRELLEWL